LHDFHGYPSSIESKYEQTDLKPAGAYG